jgi:hypothetical protein
MTDQIESAPAQEPRAHQLPPARFDFFVTTLAVEALGALGESPIQSKEGAPPEVNLPHAQHIIDLLTMLQEKTKGNLTSDEENLHQSLLTQLRLLYLQKKG